MTQLFAQPYNINATGFYFETIDEYNQKYTNNHDEYGQFVEEYEIQFINGDSIDAELFKKLSISQCNINLYLEKIEEWDDRQKVQILIASECSCDIDLKTIDPDDFDINLYEMSNLRELAEQFVNEGLYGEIPENIIKYLDYNKIVRELSFVYTETRIDNVNYVYRMG